MVYGRIDISSLKKNYSKFPNKIFKIGLIPSITLLYIFLTYLPEDFHPSIRFIAKELRMSNKTVQNGINELCSRNIINQVKQGNFKTRSQYKFVPTSLWINKTID